MKKRMLLFSLTAVACAALPAGYSHWSAEQIQDRAKGLPAKMNKVKVATESLGGWGNHSMSVVHREGSGEAVDTKVRGTKGLRQMGRNGEVHRNGANPRRTHEHEVRPQRSARENDHVRCTAVEDGHPLRVSGQRSTDTMSCVMA